MLSLSILSLYTKFQANWLKNDKVIPIFDFWAGELVGWQAGQVVGWFDRIHSVHMLSSSIQRLYTKFQPIWLKLGLESLNGRTQHGHIIYPVKPACHPQPTSLKVKNVNNFAIFQPICLKLCMETLNGIIYSFSELIGLAIFWSQRSCRIGDL